MAILAGVMRYRGSFGNIRHYRVTGNKNTFASLKGGPTAEQILTLPSLEFTRKNNLEWKGCTLAAMRLHAFVSAPFSNSLDSTFYGRAMKLAKSVQVMDYEGVLGQKSIIFSTHRPAFMDLVYSVKNRFTSWASIPATLTHPMSRAAATYIITSYLPLKREIPRGSTHFRLLVQLMGMPDYSMSGGPSYMPLSATTDLLTFRATEYSPIDTPLTESITPSFVVDTIVTEDQTIIASIMLEFSQEQGDGSYIALANCKTAVIDVF